SRAQEAPPRFVGINLGSSSVSDDVGSGPAFGLEGGALILPHLGLRGFLRAGSHSDDITSFFFGFDILYRFSESLTGFSTGASLGSGKFSSGGASGNSALAYGAKALYDYQIPTTHVTLGGDLSMTWCKPGNTTLSNVSPVLTAKWWF
ncbi:MAG: hypothetical protein KGQ59_08135, partial [Bdellovibrionales bacterium]|nr:hypothetical protein [Bdellovibrionales bacterium]